MKTKIIPFDLETAKKIQAGEIKGKIKTRDGENVRIICFDRESKLGYPIVALVIGEYSEDATYYDVSGGCEFSDETNHDLVLEVPDNEPPFKPFDKVLVRDVDNSTWHITLFGFKSKGTYFTLNGYYWAQCIPYEGNEHLLGKTDKPKED